MTDSESLTGKTIGDYEVLGIIGRGGMAVVYKARQISLDRIVALKVLLSEFAKDRPFVDRFIREAKSAAKLRHPNIVNIFDIDAVEDIHFFAMEFVDGYTLSHLIGEMGSLSPHRTVQIAKQVVGALDCAHRQGIIHRDIKCPNIMIDSDYRVTVMDFGLAKPIYTPGITRTGSLLGTPEYMSPEQCIGETLDHRSDLYSLGVVLYEMLCGHVPFQSDSMMGVIHKQVYEQPKGLHEWEPKIPPDLAKLVHRLLEKRPDDRFHAASEILRAMDRLVLPPDTRDVQPGFTDMSTVVADRPANFPDKLSDTLPDKTPEKLAIKVNARPKSRLLPIALLTIGGLILLLAYIKILPKPEVLPEPSEEPGATPTAVVMGQPSPEAIVIPAEKEWLVQVSSEPAGARIFLDGNPSGNVTPDSVNFVGLAGEGHEVRLELDGYEPVGKSIALGEMDSLQLTLKKKEVPVPKGVLLVSCPWATKESSIEILLDEKSKGKFPSNARLEGVLVGKHGLTIRCIKPYVNRSFSVDVLEGETRFEPRLEFAKLDAKANPWCYVSVNGVRLAEDTPFRDYPIAAGEYRIEFEAGAGTPSQGTRWVDPKVVVKEGQPVSLHNLHPSFIRQ